MILLPESIRTFLDEGGVLADLGDEANDRLAECVIQDRVLEGFENWDARMNHRWGPAAEQLSPERQYRQWESELANDDALADRVELLLPASVVVAWSEMVRVENSPNWFVEVHAAEALENLLRATDGDVS
jgi:hypothetical protein